MFERSKSPKSKYQSVRTIRVETMPPPYRSPTYVVESNFVPVGSYYENVYYAKERDRERERERERSLEQEMEREIERATVRERERERAKERERERATEREGGRERGKESSRRQSCSELFHNIDVIQRLGERFKGLSTTFSHPASPNNNFSSAPNGGNSENDNTNTNFPGQTSQNSSLAAASALTARIKELEKEKEMAREREVEKLNGGLNGVRGEIKGLQMRSEREEGRREGRMEGLGLGLGMGIVGDENAGASLNGIDKGWNDRIAEYKGTRRMAETLRARQGREVRAMRRRARDVDVDMLRETETETEREREREVRMNRFEDKVEGRVERVEDHVERLVERDTGRVGVREGGTDRTLRRDKDTERYTRPRFVRERQREMDWEYGNEGANGYGYGGLKYRGYV